MNQRRRFLGLSSAALLAWLAARPGSANADDSGEAAAILRQGGCAVLLRHSLTEPGIGDPAEFRLDDCTTQRNLSDQGRAQSACIGRWFGSRSLAPRIVYSSQWCRCRDTARIAFEQYEELPALNSTFQGQGDQPAQIRMLRKVLRDIPAGQFDVFVTHQVIITALAERGTSMGEAVIVDHHGKPLARFTPTC
ncbi:MAG: histidine phosphatase family protein [Burkholderiaceae bacterium]